METLYLRLMKIPQGHRSRENLISDVYNKKEKGREERTMETKIVEFLIKAKRSTYAGKGAETISSRPKSHDLAFEENELRYIDTYLGGYQFAGEEALWENGTPVWVMNYCWRVISDEFEGDFLKEALYNVPFDMPFRGPRNFLRDNFEYRCSVNGDFEWYNGVEEILKNGIKVYECIFHGGSIIG